MSDARTIAITIRVTGDVGISDRQLIEDIQTALTAHASRYAVHYNDVAQLAEHWIPWPSGGGSTRCEGCATCAPAGYRLVKAGKISALAMNVTARSPQEALDAVLREGSALEWFACTACGQVATAQHRCPPDKRQRIPIVANPDGSLPLGDLATRRAALRAEITARIAANTSRLEDHAHGDVCRVCMDSRNLIELDERRLAALDKIEAEDKTP